MERMTTRNSDGSVSQPLDLRWADALKKLAEYEDTGLTPEQVRDMAENAESRLLTWFEAKYHMPAGQLMALLDAHEGGRLLVTPCRVDETVWFIRDPSRSKAIEETQVEKIVAKGKGLYLKLACNAMYETSCNSIGKTVFLTREAAEAALAEREAENASD